MNSGNRWRLDQLRDLQSIEIRPYIPFWHLLSNGISFEILGTIGDMSAIRNLRNQGIRLGGKPLELIQLDPWADLHIAEHTKHCFDEKGRLQGSFLTAKPFKWAIIVQKHLASISPTFPSIIFERTIARKTWISSVGYNWLWNWIHIPLWECVPINN